MNKERRELIKRFSQGCLFGTCDKCSRIVNGKGIHDVEEYQVFNLTDKNLCKECKGTGIIKEPCEECQGTGEVECDCNKCEKGYVPDEDGERKDVKTIFLLKEDDKQ